MYWEIEALFIIEDDLRGEAIAALLKEHFENMHTITPVGSAHVLDLDSLRSPGITFWSAWEDEQLLGCGALKELDERSGEVKSMRTIAAYKRRGVASELLNHMAKVARQRGYKCLYLETGSFPAFRAARAFYEKHRFEYISPFGSYKEDPNSVFMAKSL